MAKASTAAKTKDHSAIKARRIDSPKTCHTCEICDLRKILLEGRTERALCDRPCRAVIGKVYILNYPVDAIGIFMEPIKAQFILNPEEDQDATGHSYSKASNIYKGIAFMSRQISECNFYVVFNHGFILFWDFVIGRHNFALEDTLTIIL